MMRKMPLKIRKKAMISVSCTALLAGQSMIIKPTIVYSTPINKWTKVPLHLPAQNELTIARDAAGQQEEAEQHGGGFGGHDGRADRNRAADDHRNAQRQKPAPLIAERVEFMGPRWQTG